MLILFHKDKNKSAVIINIYGQFELLSSWYKYTSNMISLHQIVGTSFKGTS